MRNMHPGTCYRCGTTVEPGDGHFERARGKGVKWRTQHASCAIRWRGVAAPTPAQARAARDAYLAKPRPAKKGKAS